MIKYLYTIFTSKNPHLFYHRLLLDITIVLIIYYLYRLSDPKKNKENFTQETSFILKKDNDIYDTFYAEIYNGITDRNKTCQRELYKIIKITEADTKNSLILDVGSGTGCVVNQLTKAGFETIGIDYSQDMIKHSKSIYPDIDVLEKDALNPNVFDKSVFTHILCTNFTIYELKDKELFFNNCYYWLKSNGYLIIHLVDREKFSAKTFKDSIMDIYGLYRTMKKPDNERNISTSAEFIDFIYDANYQINPKNNIVMFKEKFVDKETKHIRENENTLYMETIEDILKIASKSGFIIKGKIDMKKCNGDENQYLYIFEK
jgi:SAM-dependent methyltransferase